MHITGRFVVLVALILPMLSLCACGTKSRERIREQASAPVVLATDFGRLAGPTWRGTLTYLNYGSNEKSTIRSTLLVANVSEGVWSWATGYDDEPHADSASQVRLINAGAAIQSGDTVEHVLSRVARGDSVEIITRHQGTDDNRQATIQRVYEITPGRFSIVKLVRFEGEAEFFERHAYNWTR
jgi:hypothetical protein